MKISYNTLEGVPFDKIHDAFVSIFSDYLVDVSYMTRDKLKNRAIKNGYDPEVSIGAFIDGELKGFTLTGTEERSDGLFAFDIMTGLAKEIRGMGVAPDIFRLMVPKLRSKKVKGFFLEVLQENKAAIRAYEKTGFRITRSFDCFQISTDSFSDHGNELPGFEIRRSGKEILPEFEKFTEWQPSWENSFNSARRIPDEIRIYTARAVAANAGILVYYPALNWIMGVLVKPEFRGRGVASQLLSELKSDLSPEQNIIKALNIQSDDEATISLLQKAGFTIMTRQYEMYYEL